MNVSPSELSVDDTELITSFSNPNYAPMSGGSHTDNSYYGKISSNCHGNPSFLSSSDSYDELGNIPLVSVIHADTGPNSITFYRKDDTPSSFDSAISSPSSDSALASPCITVPEEETRTGRGEADCDATENITSNQSKDEHSEDQQQRDDEASESGTQQDADNVQVLPPGWQQCEDNNGPYYWHIKSGTIQREPPEPSSDQDNGSLSASASKVDISASSPDIIPSGKSCIQSSSMTDKGSEEKECDNLSEPQYPIRFAVRSLGWIPISEEELSQEKSSRAVNKCIVDLSFGKKDINDVVGRWGDGKYLYMDLDQENLSLIDPNDLTVLNVQPIKAIRVWGVGRDNGRDFAYVARDRNSRRFMCHVFRCELPARHIASTLCEICKKVIARRAVVSRMGSDASGHIGRPTDLPSFERNAKETGGDISVPVLNCDDILKNSSFPTPMDEPKKVMTCHYLGTTQVSMATGVEILNGAIDLLNARVPAEKWSYVNVAVAPSTITITDHETPDCTIDECRVRFLSFLGISVKNIKLCSFIMHTAQDQYVAHVFYCEPSAGALCKIIEAACKLRYQKCLDRTLSSSTSMSPLDQRLDSSENSSTINKDSSSFVDSVLNLGRMGFSSSALSNAASSMKTGLAQTASSMKTGMAETASSVRTNMASTSVAVRNGISSGTTSMKEGIISAVDSLRRKARVYLAKDEP